MQTCSVVLADVVLNFCSGTLVLPTYSTRFVLTTFRILRDVLKWQLFCSFDVFFWFFETDKVLTLGRILCRQNLNHIGIFQWLPDLPLHLQMSAVWAVWLHYCLLSTCFLKKIFKRSVLSLWYVHFNEVVL